MEAPGIFTASFFVTTDLDNNQIATFYTGAMAQAHKLSLAAQVGGADLVVISPDDPTAMIRRARECKAVGIPYLYDPSQKIVRLSQEELAAGVEGCWMLVVNQYEYSMIQNKT